MWGRTAQDFTVRENGHRGAEGVGVGLVRMLPAPCHR